MSTLARLVLSLSFTTLTFLPLAAQEEERPSNPELFPGARCDARETAVLKGADGRGPFVYRTPRPFGVVLNFYRVAGRQVVQVTKEDIGARFAAIADQLRRPDPSTALLDDPFVRRFNARADRAAWRDYAARYAGREQLVGEGQRVTIYRPYLSQRTFELINETVIVLQQHGGTCNDVRDTHPRRERRDRDDDRRRHAIDRRPGGD